MKLTKNTLIEGTIVKKGTEVTLKEMIKRNKDSKGNRINKAEFYIKGTKDNRTFLLRAEDQEYLAKLRNTMKDNKIENIEISTDRFYFDEKEIVILCDIFDLPIYARGIM